jgi:hypothetical protein
MHSSRPSVSFQCYGRIIPALFSAFSASDFALMQRLPASPSRAAEIPGTWDSPGTQGNLDWFDRKRFCSAKPHSRVSSPASCNSSSGDREDRPAAPTRGRQQSVSGCTALWIGRLRTEVGRRDRVTGWKRPGVATVRIKRTVGRFAPVFSTGLHCMVAWRCVRAR